MTDRQTTARWQADENRSGTQLTFYPTMCKIKIWQKKMYIKEVKGVGNKNVLQV